MEKLSWSELCQNSLDTLYELVECYNTTLAQALDRHAPLRTKVISSRPLVPWFNEEVKVARGEKRQAERMWRRSKCNEDMLKYKTKKNTANDVMNEARRQFYENFIEENSSNQSDLFKAVKKLLGQDDSNDIFPPHDDKGKLANQMGNSTNLGCRFLKTRCFFAM